jgi:uncharacterized membrane protein YedE/YeeE
MSTIITAFIIGLFFGAIMQLAQLDRLAKVIGAFLLKDLTIPKALLMAMGVGAILIYTAEYFGLIELHIKPFYPVGIAIGGLIFGAGMVIVGYCPGSMPEAVGEGRIDALFGIIAGIIGGVVFTMIYPVYEASFLHGEVIGKQTLADLFGLTGVAKWLFSVFVGGLFIALAFLVDKLEKKYLQNS